jgi:mono/diheme cytochrome c family protein
MVKGVSVFLFAGLSVLTAHAQEAAKPPQNPPATESKIPEDAKKQVNPVKVTADSIAMGKKQYGTECAMCHGQTGDGKGDLAADMKLNLADLRDAATLKDVTDGEIFYLIKNGKGDMPGEGDRLKAPEIWDLVIYVRSLPKKDTAGK